MYVRGRAMEVVRGGGADHLARCLANIPDKQAAALITVESLGLRTSYLERALDPRLSLEACKKGDNGAQWAYKKPSKFRERRRHNSFPGGVPGQSADSQTLPASPTTPVLGSGRVRAAVDRSKENVGIHREQDGDLAGAIS